MDWQLRTRLALDAEVSIVTADGREDRRLVRAVLSARERQRARSRRRTQPRVYRRDFRALALRVAREAGIRRPRYFVRQIAAESGFQPCAVSSAGAVGIAQIMPATARSWEVDPWIPEDALHASATAMARYERQLGSYELALAAYNAGPGAVQEWGGVPPYEETKRYIERVMNPSEELPGMSQVFTVEMRMGPGFSARLDALIQDVERRGSHLSIEDGWRSYEDSLAIWRAAKRRHGGWEAARHWAAPPGCSNHVRGWAADLRGDLDLAHRLAPRYGLVFPMTWEPWHVELAGIDTQSG